MRRRARGEGRGALLLAVVLAACGADAGSDGRAAFALRGATVVDGNGGTPITDAVVVIAEGRITAVGPADQVAIPREARVEDVTGAFLLPGLIDVHAHVLVPRCDASGAPIGEFDWAMSRAMMVALLGHGITTARSPATPTVLGVAMRDSLATGAFPGPRLLVAGDLINGRTATPDAVRATVREQAAAGVDFIKLYAALSPDAVAAAIDEAHAHGLRVIGHLERASWSDALDAGIDHLTHVVPWNAELLPADRRAGVAQAVDRHGPMRARVEWLEAFDPEAPSVDSLIARLVRHGVPVDPTLVAFDTKFSHDPPSGRAVASRYREHPARDAVPGLRETWESCGVPTDGWDAGAFRRIGAAWPRLLRLVHRYHEGGVMLTTGSDMPNPWVIPGEGLHRELELLVEAGIAPSEVLRIATRNGAAALGLLDETGTIEVGKRADLVLLDADPLADITNTRRIVWVMQGGVRRAATEGDGHQSGDRSP